MDNKAGVRIGDKGAVKIQAHALNSLEEKER